VSGNISITPTPTLIRRLQSMRIILSSPRSTTHGRQASIAVGQPSKIDGTRRIDRPSRPTSLPYHQSTLRISPNLTNRSQVHCCGPRVESTSSFQCPGSIIHYHTCTYDTGRQQSHHLTSATRGLVRRESGVFWQAAASSAARETCVSASKQYSGTLL
jgi:hypothetical protein